MSHRARKPLAVLLLAVVLLACGGDDDTVAWRGATLEVPEDWVVFEEESTRLSLGNAPLGEERPDTLGDDVVAMFFTHEPSAVPDDWRGFVDGREEGEIESDESIELDGVPATRLVYTHRSNEVLTREMAVVVPARGVVVLAQPVPTPDDEDTTEQFTEHREQFRQVLESIEWGAPVED